MKILSMRGIRKAFFGVTVLDDVSLEVEQGEVHALLGENGAGKSTLMNILGGVYTRDVGSVVFNGHPMDNITIKMASNAGISFVHQELNVVNHLAVYENLFLNQEITGFLGKLNKKAMIERTAELFNQLGVSINPQAMVEELDTSEKQLLEIAKSLFADAKLFILDEPTTALNNKEIDNLFSIINRLKELGKTFIFISHKMPEIFRIADSYTVLRNARFINSGKISEVTPEEITRMMIGENYSNREVYHDRKTGEPVLELNHYSGEGFEDVTLTVHRGAVIGLTGLQGSGASNLLQAIFGVQPAISGELKLFGESVGNQPINQRMRGKIAMLASNRKENSVIQDMNLLENMYIAEHTLSGKKQHIILRQELSRYAQYRDMLSIKANDYHDLITSLSGGNQQKVILARWLNTQAEILLLDNPTQGIDVGAKAEIYRLILELADAGKTIIVNTLEIPELQKIADHCVVFYHGKIQIILEHHQISEETVMMHATHALKVQEEFYDEK